jgi:hypothetical protein
MFTTSVSILISSSCGSTGGVGVGRASVWAEAGGTTKDAPTIAANPRHPTINTLILIFIVWSDALVTRWRSPL